MSIAPVEGGAEIGFRLRGQTQVEQLRAARIVNCTGPEMDIGRAGEPLLDALLAAGAIRQDALGVGIDVDEACRAIGARRAGERDALGDRPGDARHLLGERRRAGYPRAGGSGWRG